MNTQQEVKVVKQVDYDTLRCLVTAAFLLGQETGLKQMTYNHPVAKNYRETLIELIINPLDKES
jgi:hypothetical protein